VKRSLVPLGVALLLCQAPASAEGPEGERVVLIGGTLIEREQAQGYLETRWTCARPDRPITFRNLGWSGDTVEGPSRARFGTTADGFRHLKEHVLALKPTVIVVGYGGVEGFDGAAGVDRFRKGLDTLLDTLEPAHASLVLLTPNRQEDLGRPLPDPARHNADLALYRDVIVRDAYKSRWSKYADQKRRADYVDLFDDLPDGAKANPRRPLTDNGIHFNAYGYWRASAVIDHKLNNFPRQWSVGCDLSDRVTVATNTQFTGTFTPIPGGLRLQLLDEALPAPLPPDGGPGLPGHAGTFETRTFRARNLGPGRYALTVDGKPVATAGADAWAQGVVIRQGPEFDQVEALRSVIVAKNELYFHRWRPQNETYLFGFRKHEQGRNAREIPEFDPLIAAKEAEIARLRVPVPHVYELTREGEVGR